MDQQHGPPGAEAWIEFVVLVIPRPLHVQSSCPLRPPAGGRNCRHYGVLAGAIGWRAAAYRPSSIAGSQANSRRCRMVNELCSSAHVAAFRPIGQPMTQAGGESSQQFGLSVFHRVEPCQAAAFRCPSTHSKRESLPKTWPAGGDLKAADHARARMMIPAEVTAWPRKTSLRCGAWNSGPSGNS
jgi:hypothetical protein